MGSIESWSKQQSLSREVKSVSVVIPAYNEARRLPSTLIEVLLYFAQRPEPLEIIVVDDGSTDLTRELVSCLEEKFSPINLNSLRTNSGKGAALRAGMSQARGDLVLLLDADGSTPIYQFEKLLRALPSEGEGIVIGSRSAPGDDEFPEGNIKALLHRKILGRLFQWRVKQRLGLCFHDTQCGFKLLTKGVSQFLSQRAVLSNFAFDIEMLYLAALIEVPVREVPIDWSDVPGSKVRVFRDGFEMLSSLSKIEDQHHKASPQDFIDFQNSSLMSRPNQDLTLPSAPRLMRKA